MTTTEHLELKLRLDHLERAGRDLSRALNEEIGANTARDRALSERLRRLERQLGELSAVLDAVHTHVHRLAERVSGERAAGALPGLGRQASELVGEEIDV